jgi:hypothetical protein
MFLFALTLEIHKMGSAPYTDTGTIKPKAGQREKTDRIIAVRVKMLLLFIGEDFSQVYTFNLALLPDNEVAPEIVLINLPAKTFPERPP